MSEMVARATGKLLGRFSKSGVVAGQFLNIAQGVAECGFGGCAAFVELVECAHGGGIKFFGVGEDALFGFEGLVFAGFEMGLLDLLALIGPKVDHAQAVLLAVEQVVEFVLSGAPASVGFGYGVSGNAGETVEEDALLRGIETRQALSLRVDESQLGRELLEHLRRLQAGC